jgi:uncharacterized membrane protein HdeD (DUF308 family)
MTGEMETSRKAAAIISNLTALLGLLVLGYPLAPATIRTMLFGWILIAVTIMQSIFGHFQTTRSSVTVTRHPYSRSSEKERIAIGSARE